MVKSNTLSVLTHPRLLHFRFSFVRYTRITVTTCNKVRVHPVGLTDLCKKINIHLEYPCPKNEYHPLTLRTLYSAANSMRRRCCTHGTRSTRTLAGCSSRSRMVPASVMAAGDDPMAGMAGSCRIRSDILFRVFCGLLENYTNRPKLNLCITGRLCMTI